jgi:hypothetical protein
VAVVVVGPLALSVATVAVALPERALTITATLELLTLVAVVVVPPVAARLERVEQAVPV